MPPSTPSRSTASSSTTEAAPGRLARLLDRLAFVVAALWILAVLRPHLQVALAVTPQELNEPSLWYTTWLLDQGRNPYAHAELPGAAQFFGPLYHLCILALKPVLGIGYDAHRLFNALCLFAGLAYLGTRLVRLGAGPGLALLCVALFYRLAVINIMITARPDAPGLLLFLIALFHPWERGYTPRAVAVGLACTLLAFHCKAYFALSLLPILAGLAAAGRWRHTFVAGAAFTAALGLSVALLSARFPLYVTQVFVMQRQAVIANSDAEQHWLHTALFFERTWPFLLLLAGAAPLLLRWRRDPAAARRLAPWIAAFFLHLVLVLGWMGRNGGASFTYHLHLIFPPLFVLAACVLRASPARRALFTLPFLVLVFQLGGVREFEDAMPGYTRLQQIIAENDPVLDSISAATELLATHGRPVTNSGFSLFLPFATADGRAATDPHAAAIHAAFQRTYADARRRIAAREFDVLLLTLDECYLAPMELVRAHYTLAETIALPMYFGHSAVQVWKPRPPRPH